MLAVAPGPSSQNSVAAPKKLFMHPPPTITGKKYSGYISLLASTDNRESLSTNSMAAV